MCQKQQSNIPQWIAAPAFVLVAALSISSCATSKDTYRVFETAPLFGMVYDTDHQACSSVRVYVDGIEQSVSDINGRFVIPNLEKGAHVVTASKDGYEELSVPIEFLNISQVLYLKMMSFDQLLAEAEHALERNESLSAKDFLDRAEKLRGGDPVHQFLMAVYLRAESRYDEAVNILSDLAIRGYTSPEIYLLLADIYQYDLNDTRSALPYITSLLDDQKDERLQKRLAELQDAAGD